MFFFFFHILDYNYIFRLLKLHFFFFFLFHQAFKLSWDIISESEDAAEIASYEIFMHGRKYKPDFWKKVGTVRAVTLPMGCTIRNVNIYIF